MVTELLCASDPHRKIVNNKGRTSGQVRSFTNRQTDLVGLSAAVGSSRGSSMMYHYNMRFDWINIAISGGGTPRGQLPTLFPKKAMQG